jgi:DNA-binding MurR/RpiR family transcriptional regulator
MSEAKPGVQLSWAEAVRVVPELAAGEAERACTELEAERARVETLELKAQVWENVARDALAELRECLLQMDAEEWERARAYVVKAKAILSGGTVE